jgi:hypothetical protein
MFERRWTVAALKRVNLDVAERLSKQQDLFNHAAVTGTAEEIEGHGAALCRGYAAAVRALEATSEPDDSYILGQDPRSGFKVAIGHQKTAAERVVELHGNTAFWISPDEVAAVLAQLDGLKALCTIKRMFPGAEVIDIRPQEPGKSDSGIKMTVCPPRG